MTEKDKDPVPQGRPQDASGPGFESPPPHQTRMGNRADSGFAQQARFGTGTPRFQLCFSSESQLVIRLGRGF